MNPLDNNKYVPSEYNDGIKRDKLFPGSAKVEPSQIKKEVNEISKEIIGQSSEKKSPLKPLPQPTRLTVENQNTSEIKSPNFRPVQDSVQDLTENDSNYSLDAFEKEIDTLFSEATGTQSPIPNKSGLKNESFMTHFKNLKKIISNLFNRANRINDPEIKNDKISVLKNELFSLVEEIETDDQAKIYNEEMKRALSNGTYQNLSDLKEAFLNKLDSNPDGLSYGIRFLSQLHHNNPSGEVKEFGKEISRIILERHKSGIGEINKVSSSQAEREVLRTPTEVAIDLLAYIKNNPNESYKGLEQEVKSLFLTHNTTIEKMESFLNTVSERFPESDISKKCHELNGQLMKKAIYTRLHDNIYGRAFDSAFVSELVNNPPEEVQTAMNTMSQGFAHYLTGLDLSKDMKRKVSQEIREVLVSKDPRFWFPAVPALDALADDDKLFDAMITYLNSNKSTGYECMSVPYLISKVSPILRGNLMYPPWSLPGDINYKKNIEPQVAKVRIERKNADPLKSRGGGITLQYQPSISDGVNLVESQRPSAVRRPDLEFDNVSKKEKVALQNQLERGVPWASGMSGTTNICVYAWNYFNRKNPIAFEPAMLGFLMFLVHDGGHSINEPLWALSQINGALDLGLDIGASGKLEEFTPDYEKFTNMYNGELKEKVSAAFDKSFDRVVEYYNEHSYYSDRKPPDDDHFIKV